MLERAPDTPQESKESRRLQSVSNSAPPVAASASHRMLRLTAGAILSLIAFAFLLAAASTGLQALLMGVVFIKEAATDRPAATASAHSPTAAPGKRTSVAESTRKARRTNEDPKALADYEAPTQPRTTASYGIEAGGALLACAASLGVMFLILRLRRKIRGVVVETSLARFLSVRYLLAREGRTLISLITLISVMGIAVGVMALVVVISVMQGFHLVLTDRLMGVFSHVEVWPQYADEPLADWEKQLEVIRKVPGVVAASPVINQPTFMQRESGADRDRAGVVLRGLDMSIEGKVSTLTHKIERGVGTPGENEVVLGREVARRMHVAIGDTVWVSGVIARTANGPVPKLLRLKVVGTFTSGLFDIDQTMAYTTIPTAQRLFNLKNNISFIHARVENPDRAPELRSLISEKLQGDVLVRPWQEINRPFFQALAMEKIAMFVILSLIVVVAAFNIIGTLIMIVSKKTREIGILKAMGATRGDILRVFLMVGFVIGVVGNGVGLALGLRLCWFVRHHIEKIYELPGTVYYGLERLPVVVDPQIVLAILGTSMFICTTAAIIPAVQASRLKPVEALRYE